MIRIALAGYGTVGQGVFDLFHLRRESLQRRLGRRVEIDRILVRDVEKAREIDPKGARYTRDAWEILSDEGIQVLIEATGDVELAYVLITEALKRGKHVITANKSLLSLRLEELSELAQARGVYLLYEASVGGGTPLIKPLQDLSVHGEIRWFRGLLSGSCNYVLTRMRKENAPYEAVVREAKALGYLEADPTDDVGGFDTRRKLRILASLAFRGVVKEEEIEREGIEKLSAQDIRELAGLGYAVRLVAQAHRVGHRFQASVHPVALPLAGFLGSMDGADNGVEFFGDHFLHVSFQGSGAGRYPTAHAVLADLEDVLFGHRSLVSPVSPIQLFRDPFVRESRYFVRGEGFSFPLERRLSENSYLTAPIARNRLKDALPAGASAIAVEE